jgi:hypothetical protein
MTLNLNLNLKMASMEDTSDCESVVGVFTLVKKVESKQKSLDYFKKGDIRKTNVSYF